MVAPFRFDRAWHFAVPPAALWTTLTAVDDYRDWWPWIVALDLDGPPFAVASRAHVVVQAPLPYRLHCTTTVADVEPEVRLVAHVEGDLAGHASLAVAPTVDGSAAHLSWELDVRSPALRALASVARPAMVWGHDRIVERGLREFEQRALAGTRAAPGGPSSAAQRAPAAPRSARRGPAPPPPPA